MTEIKIISGQTWHGRRGRVENDFKYSIDYLLFDPEKLEMSPWLLSKKGGFFYGINPLDYGGLNDLGAPKKWVLEVLKARKITCVSKVLLLAQPRILGHIFNPVSFWLCFEYFSCKDFIAYEIALTINAWCFDMKKGFQHDNYVSFMEGFNEHASLNEDEVNALNILLRGAALRILITRLHDKIYHPKEALVIPKDPREYLNILKWHQENNITEL